MDLSTAGLISDVKLNALLPDGMFENDDIISFLNDAFYTDALPFLMRFREDFFISYTDFSPAASITIPSDAIAQKLKDVQIKKDDNTFYNLPRLSMGEITSPNSSWNRPDGFYIQDNTIIFYPRPQTNTIRVVYYKRPYPMADSNEDTGTTKNYTISAIKTSLEVEDPYVEIGSSNLAYTISQSTPLTLTHSYQPFDTLDVVTTTGSTTNGNRIYFSDETLANMTVGDVLCSYGDRGFPKVPLEVRDVIVQAAIVKAMIAMKDKDGYSLAKEQLADAKSAAAGLISPRIDNEVKKIVNRGPLWGSRNHNGWRK